MLSVVATASGVCHMPAAQAQCMSPETDAAYIVNGWRALMLQAVLGVWTWQALRQWLLL